MKKAITILFISLLLCINTMAVQSGKCGDNATWTLSDDSVLTISGTGEIKKFDIDKNKVKEVVIEDGITAIRFLVFEGCEKMREIKLPNTINKIGYGSFMNCKSLKKITIPESVHFTGGDVFNGCVKLINVIIKSTNIFIQEDFYECNNLKFNKYNNAYYLGNEENPYLVLIKPTSPNIVKCQINERCKIMNTRAFAGCKRLRSIDIPDSVVIISHDLFDNCTGLKSVRFSNSTKEIQASLSICKKLRTIICEAETPPHRWGIYGPDVNAPIKSTTLYVPKNSIQAYKEDYAWNMYKNIKAIEDVETDNH
ncbi:MAG: leucine-rich repeat domain-containing protein [Paludibacteraceae bacterium]|nr:leucine-rich repeat domain-containing protein [Paludibacteraceae bacterium]